MADSRVDRKTTELIMRLYLRTHVKGQGHSTPVGQGRHDHQHRAGLWVQAGNQQAAQQYQNRAGAPVC